MGLPAEIFTRNGGKFITKSSLLQERLKLAEGILLDWDGVFNSGTKGVERHSTFNEVDSMGINMLRFGYFLKNGHLPFTAIVTGEENPTAFYWAKREHINAVFYKAKHKEKILSSLAGYKVTAPEKLLFVFDDILDISLAHKVGIRFLIGRKANQLFENYCQENNYCDYITGCQGYNGGLREISELVLSAIDQFETSIEHRVAYSESYQEYLRLRNSITTDVLSLEAH